MSTSEPHAPALPAEAVEDRPDVAAAPAGPPPLSPLRAIGEVVLCSSYPTQILAATALALAGVPAQRAGGLNPTFVVAMALIDAVLVVGLVV